MAIPTTYAELKTEIADWLHRSDLASKIPNFIALAESRMNRKLGMSQKEVDASLTMTPGSRYVALPTYYNTPIALWLETWQPRTELTLKNPKELPVTADVSGTPSYWAIDGTNIAFDLPADQAHTLTLRYVRTLALSDTVTTNAILTKYPDAYLYGALASAAPYLGNDERLATWRGLWDEAIQEISNDEAKNKSRAPLATEISGLFSNTFNIHRGS